MEDPWVARTFHALSVTPFISWAVIITVPLPLPSIPPDDFTLRGKKEPDLEDEAAMVTSCWRHVAASCESKQMAGKAWQIAWPDHSYTFVSERTKVNTVPATLSETAMGDT